LIRSITEVEWREAKVWTEPKVSGKKYWNGRHREPRLKVRSGIATADKRIGVRFYQLTIAHQLTGKYLVSSMRSSLKSCWCSYRTERRKMHFKRCPHGKRQWIVPWAEVLRETGRWKNQFKLRDLADEGPSRVRFNFFSTTDVGAPGAGARRG